jgi:uncharacterized protein (DUF1015 family)
MAQIEAFRGLRYDTDRVGPDLTRFISPPYDVLSAEQKAELLSNCDRNITAIDLPVAPAKKPGPDEAYATAGRTYSEWQTDGTLKADDAASIYAYSQTFDLSGSNHVRRGFIARLRLEEFGEGSVYPHEETFSGPRADRLKLTQACQANTSQVFVLISNGAGMTEAVYSAATGEPDAFGAVDNVRHELHCIGDAEVIDRVRSAARDEDVYIADGHHRYTTSLNYRKWLIEETGGIPDDHPANFISCAFVGLDDPGLLILPTHRVVELPSDFNMDGLLARLGESFSCRSIEGKDVDWSNVLDDAGGGAIGMMHGATGQRRVITRRDDDPLAAYAADRSTSWRTLDVTILHRLIIDQLLFAGKEDESGANVQYVKDAAEAEDAAREGNGMAFLLQATPAEGVRAVSAAGELMPQKSTFFYPKVATGLVINPLE